MNHILLIKITKVSFLPRRTLIYFRNRVGQGPKQNKCHQMFEHSEYEERQRARQQVGLQIKLELHFQQD